MNDLISRSALIEKLMGCTCTDKHDELIIKRFVGDMVRSFPTVDAVPVVHGEWIKKLRSNGGYIASITCSVCGCSWHRATYNFCPECGADMRGGKNVL